MTFTILQSGVPSGTGLLVGIFAIALPLIISFFIYRDANDRGSRHTLAWGLGSFFGGLVVWILYFVVRDEIGLS